MGSLRDFQWALLHKIQELEYKDVEITELRKLLHEKDTQLEFQKKETARLREMIRVAAVIIPPVTSVVMKAPMKKRVAISAEPIDAQAVITLKLKRPARKSSQYVRISSLDVSIDHSLSVELVDSRLPL